MLVKRDVSICGRTRRSMAEFNGVHPRHPDAGAQGLDAGFGEDLVQVQVFLFGATLPMIRWGVGRARCVLVRPVTCRQNPAVSDTQSALRWHEPSLNGTGRRLKILLPIRRSQVLILQGAL
ncbi:hypothetical protein GCM10009733_018080 [Nonomuraea maheshkhaliensis]|uniref:Uncharacterized protein n=1 Tax=Nonomuraea maheshkhaliensis TaxID=419590 RepID=A0ABN2EYE0_9ACTN